MAQVLCLHNALPRQSTITIVFMNKNKSTAEEALRMRKNAVWHICSAKIGHSKILELSHNEAKV